ncbi:hypothetical protein ACFX15_023660 [Malus domestica]
MQALCHVSSNLNYHICLLEIDKDLPNTVPKEQRLYSFKVANPKEAAAAATKENSPCLSSSQSIKYKTLRFPYEVTTEQSTFSC